jgi:proteasome component ECM29
MGYLLRLASDDQVLKTIDYAKKLYLNAEDANTRTIAAEILYSASKLSNDRFMAFATAALPFVFVCKHDADEHVKEEFDKTWQDNVGGNRAVSLYLREIVELVADNLDSARWAIKHTAARAIAQAVLSLEGEMDLPTAQLVWPVLEKALSGKTWEGKEVVLTALVKFARSGRVLWTSRTELAELLKVRLRLCSGHSFLFYFPYFPYFPYFLFLFLSLFFFFFFFFFFCFCLSYLTMCSRDCGPTFLTERD